MQKRKLYTGLFESIQETTDRKGLVALGLAVQGVMKAGLIEPMYYADCCVLLTNKLGFAITSENLDREYEFYMKDRGK